VTESLDAAAPAFLAKRLDFVAPASPALPTDSPPSPGGKDDLEATAADLDGHLLRLA
jgi:hypothetical protein